MKIVLPLLVLSTALLSGCTAQTQDEVDDPAPRLAITQTPVATPTPTVAPAPLVVEVEPEPAPVTAPAPAYVDYITPVQNRWGGCFASLGVGDLYYDSTTSTVHGGWNSGALVWSVGPSNKAGTPANQESVDALAGC